MPMLVYSGVYHLAAYTVNPGNLPQVGTGHSEAQTILQFVFGIVGALAFLMIVISGLRYILSADNPDRASRAKNGIIYALVGVAIALSAEIIVTFVVKRV